MEFRELQLSVGVRADFAVKIDFFVLRCGPFHGWLLEIGTSKRPPRIARPPNEGKKDVGDKATLDAKWRRVDETDEAWCLIDNGKRSVHRRPCGQAKCWRTTPQSVDRRANNEHNS